MSNTLYLACESGISGDMTVAALLDLGADEKGLLKVLDSIPADGYSIQISRVKKAGLDCCDFDVKLEQAYENHDHDMEYLYGHLENQMQHEHEHSHGHDHTHDHDHSHEHHHDHEHTHEHDHNHEHNHEHTHEHSHEHAHSHDHANHHVHRGFADVKAIIEQTEMSERAKELAISIFTCIAHAEAKAHGETFESVHFHEVGAIDSIVDVIAVAYCIDNLDIKEVIVPYVCEGMGSVRCQHGILPIPVPAVANIVSQHGLKLKIVNRNGELVTPTGAAIVAALKTSDQLPEFFAIKKIGLGAGKRAYEHPSIVRAMLIESQDEQRAENEIVKLETNIDDCSGEQLGYAMEQLFDAGALDVFFTPIYMKKNRPATMLSVLCKPGDVSKMEGILFKETTTIGIRRMQMERSVLKREARKVMTPYGEVIVKECTLPDGEKRIYPEYESVRSCAQNASVSYEKVRQEIKNVIQ